MKQTIKLGMCAAIAVLSLGSNWTFAQFQIYNVPPLAGRTQPNITAIGIGNFPNAVSPLSALHVNTNLLPGTPTFLPGEVFRTDCPKMSTPFGDCID